MFVPLLALFLIILLATMIAGNYPEVFMRVGFIVILALVMLWLWAQVNN